MAVSTTSATTKKFAPFLSGDLELFDWAERLHMQFGAYFAKHRAQQSAGSHRAVVS